MTETELSCLSCGACCRCAGDGTILVEANDLLRWRRNGLAELEGTLVPGHFSLPGLPADELGHCRYLGDGDNEHACSIYAARPESCRALEPASPQCLSYRKQAGLTEAP